MATRSYDGRGIRVLWRPERCIHTEHCMRHLPSVFDAGRRPWIDAEAADTDELARVVELCPSGALAYERLDGSGGELAEVPTRVIPSPDGPLHLRGRLRVESPDGELIAEATRLTLCRCGATGNPPFCDNSHARTGFDAGASDARPTAAEGNGLPPDVTTVVPTANGPLRVRGELRLETPDGELLGEAREVTLCRCGRSATKPLCDGSHKEAT